MKQLLLLSVLIISCSGYVHGMEQSATKEQLNHDYERLKYVFETGDPGLVHKIVIDFADHAIEGNLDHESWTQEEHERKIFESWRLLNPNNTVPAIVQDDYKFNELLKAGGLPYEKYVPYEQRAARVRRQ